MLTFENKTTTVESAERRRFPRWTWRADVQGIYIDAEGNRRVESLATTDISRCGLGAIAQRDHEVGQHFVICLPEPTGRTRYVHATVVRCWEDGTGRHMGMRFSDPPSDLGFWLNSRLAA